MAFVSEFVFAALTRACLFCLFAHDADDKKTAAEEEYYKERYYNAGDQKPK